jgi:hypothetical protein
MVAALGAEDSRLYRCLSVRLAEETAEELPEEAW